MYNPVLHTLSVQRAAMYGWLRATHAWTESWMALMAHNTDVLASQAQRRVDDWQKQPFAIPRGPCWTDFYGNRAHDIDIEHV